MTSQLAEWSPRYFHPHVDAEVRHEGWLTYLVTSADHDTQVITEGGSVVGFFNVVSQPAHSFVDDLVSSETSRWEEVARLVGKHVSDPWVTCVSHFDTVRSAGLFDAGLVVSSTYWASALEARAEPQFADGGLALPRSRTAARHTFGGRPLDPDAPGALVLSSGSGDYLIGSASVTPPLYDPGGPTTVIDQVAGEHRADLLDAAMAKSAARGDAQVIVVCDNQDDELRQILERRGYRKEVDLIGTPSSAGHVAAAPFA